MKQRGMGIVWSILAVGMIQISGHVKADGLCDLALTSGAFNTSDYAHNARLVLKKRDDVCKSEYDSQTEAISAGQQSGGSIGYGGFNLGLSEAKQKSNQKWSISDSKFCQATAEELESFTSTVAKQQVADSALQAWNECLEKSNRLNLKYTLNPDGTGMRGTIVRMVMDGGGFGSVTGIMSSDPSVEVVCRIGTATVELNKPVKIPIKKGETGLSCNKSANESVGIALSTDVGDTAWLTLPSKKQQESVSLQQVNAAVDSLRQQHAMQLAQYSDSKKESDSRHQALAEQLAELTQRINILASTISAGMSWHVTLPHLQLASCEKNGQLGCMAGAHRYCANSGGKGGFIQEWSGPNIEIVCVK